MRSSALPLALALYAGIAVRAGAAGRPLDTTVEIKLDGYIESCSSPRLFKREGASWMPAATELPGKGLYYLDDKFVGYGFCDNVVCNKIEGTYRVRLVEYRKTGTQPPPRDSGTTSPAVPAYETVALRGRIRVELDRFADDKCRVKKTFSKVFRR